MTIGAARRARCRCAAGPGRNGIHRRRAALTGYGFMPSSIADRRQFADLPVARIPQWQRSFASHLASAATPTRLLLVGLPAESSRGAMELGMTTCKERAAER